MGSRTALAALFGVSVLLALASHAQDALVPQRGLSPRTALDVIARDGLGWGTDAQFTYGPLAFIDVVVLWGTAIVRAAMLWPRARGGGAPRGVGLGPGAIRGLIGRLPFDPVPNYQAYQAYQSYIGGLDEQNAERLVDDEAQSAIPLHQGDGVLDSRLTEFKPRITREMVCRCGAGGAAIVSCRPRAELPRPVAVASDSPVIAVDRGEDPDRDEPALQFDFYEQTLTQ